MSTNRLNLEKSPYLRQHENNPVHWHAWGPEAFEEARKSNKPIFLSIGYSTCHWCHVMAHESFEDQAVADLLNHHFISIKVDREERPDVDEIYMSAIQAMGLRGGWPLSAFLTPDLKPFYGGTYWPKPHFLNILTQLSRLWEEEQSKATRAGDDLFAFLQEMKIRKSDEIIVDAKILEKFYLSSLQSFDRQWGGFGGAPKFPHSVQLSMLLRYAEQHPESEALSMVVLSLEKMARGGIYDHVGGGFARYSVDGRWEIPHFEKMLYDNALLTVAYLEAFQKTKAPFFKAVAEETLLFVQRELRDPQGGFYSALDADSEGHEGTFYVWSWDELSRLLSEEELSYWSGLYGASAQGNFEGKNHFHLAENVSWSEKSSPKHEGIRLKLFEHREKRIRPHRDEKILTSWNGLMLRAFALGYRLLQNPEFLKTAQAAAQFLKQNLWVEGHLLARYCDGEARFSARLEDYAFLIQGLIDLYQCDFNPQTLQWAFELQQAQDRDFWDTAQGGYFYTDGKDPSLLLKTKEGMDGALPNSNGMSAYNLLRLYGFSGETQYREKAEKIFSIFGSSLSDYPHAFSQMILAYDLYHHGVDELAIIRSVEGDASEIVAKLSSEFNPYLLIAETQGPADFPALLRNKEAIDDLTFYLCRGQTCEAPILDVQELLKKIHSQSV